MSDPTYAGPYAGIDGSLVFDILVPVPKGVPLVLPEVDCSATVVGLYHQGARLLLMAPGTDPAGVADAYLARDEEQGVSLTFNWPIKAGDRLTLAISGRYWP